MFYPSVACSVVRIRQPASIFTVTGYPVYGLYEQHYVYDADNRLTAAHGRGPQGEFRAQYHYDALGRRTRKQVDYKGKAAQSTRFLWQGYRLLQEQRDDGTRRSWSYEPDSPWTPLAAIEQAGESRQADIFWLHSEQNGAPLEVTDGEGGLRWSGDYDTFGRLQGQTAASIMQRRGAAYEQPLCYARQYRLSSVYPSLIIILPASGYDVSITTLKTATAG